MTSAITTRELHNADEEPKNPPHQSDLIRTEGIEELGLSSVSKAAKLLKVRRATLSEPLHGKSAVTPEMALRIEKAIGPDMNHLLSMQLAYDVARMRGDAKRINVKRAFRREKAGVYRLYQLAL